jgi:membrane protease YdiL (CAAX protease family)
MGTILLTQTAIAAIVFLVSIIIGGKRILASKTLLISFLALYFADNLLIVLTNQNRVLQLIPNHTWEGFLVCSWSGKLYSILFTLIVLHLTRRVLTTEETGLALHQKRGSFLPSSIVVLILAGWAYIVGKSSPKGRCDPITLLYLALMPALNEELVYRGRLLGILNRLKPAKVSVLGAQIGWGGIVTSIPFSLLHGFWLGDSLSIHIELVALRNSFISSLIFI